MQTSIDLPSPLGIVQTSSITSTGKILSPDYENNLKNAAKRSEEDKLFRKQNQMNDQEEFEAIEVQNGEQISLIYYYKALKMDEVIQQNENEIINIVQNRPKLGMIEGSLMKKSPHWFQGYSQRNCIQLIIKQNIDQNRFIFIFNRIRIFIQNKLEITKNIGNLIILRNRVFRYYNVENKKLQGVLNFDVQSFQLQELQDKNGNTIEFILKPLGQTQKVFQFKGGTVDQTKTWVQLIKQHLQDSIGALKVLKSLSQYERFWRFERISTLQIMEDAEDGDILLFQGKDINCHIQRTLTQSNFDHIGILIRLDENQLYLFEALPLHGVGLCRWSKFIICKWNYLYHKIIYRKLQVIRDDNFKSRMHEFVTDNIGKQYSFNPSKLFKFRSTMLQDPQQQQTRTFFSSELVAACYKYLNLISKEISSTQYWPGSFSSENQKLALQYGITKLNFQFNFLQYSTIDNRLYPCQQLLNLLYYNCVQPIKINFQFFGLGIFFFICLKIFILLILLLKDFKKFIDYKKFLMIKTHILQNLKFFLIILFSFQLKLFICQELEFLFHWQSK